MATHGLVDLPYPDIREPLLEDAFSIKTHQLYKEYRVRWRKFRGMWDGLLNLLPSHAQGLESLVSSKLLLPDELAFLYRYPTREPARAKKPLRYEIKDENQPEANGQLVELPRTNALVLQSVKLYLDTSVEGTELQPVVASATHAGRLVVARFISFEDAMVFLDLNANPLHT